MRHMTNWQHARRAALCIAIGIPASIWSETDGIAHGYQLLCFAASIIAIICALFHVYCINEKNNPLRPPEHASGHHVPSTERRKDEPS